MKTGKICFRQLFPGTVTSLLFVLPQAAVAIGHHQVFVTSNAGLMQTSLGNNSVTAVSFVGGNLGYAYRTGFSTAFFLQYGLLLSGSDIMLRGFTAGFDYALLGGQNISRRLSSEALFDFEFPFRVGLFAGGTQRSYSFKDFIPEDSISFEKRVPNEGSFMGPTGGVSLEIPLNESTAVLIRANAILPWFSDEPTQKGLIYAGGAGLGFLF